jgi:mono/diheme cytochrome c family protein
VRARLAWAGLVLLLAAGSGHAQGGASLPDGPGAEVVRSRCLACHQTDLIEQQRLSAAGWTREVGKMERWGAQLTDAQRDTLISYLTTHFGPRPRLTRTSIAAPDQLARGESVMQRACRPCHGTDLMAQQRLPRAGWVREVDKMIRWGAKVGDTEKDALVDYLTATWGARP